MTFLRSSCVLMSLAIAAALAVSPALSKAADSVEGSWPNKIAMYWDSVDDIPLKNVAGVKAIKLKLDLRRWEYDKRTGEVKSISGGLTHQQVFDDSTTGKVLYQLDDGKTRYPLPELVIEGMEAKAVEQFSFFVKNTKTTTIRADKSIPDELILTITHTNADLAAKDIPINKVRFRPRYKK